MQTTDFSMLTWRQVTRHACTALGLVAAGCAQAAGTTEAELIQQLKSRVPTVAQSVADDPDADFSGTRTLSKSLNRVRAPDTKGACTPDEHGPASFRTLVVVPMAAAGAPEVLLRLQFEYASYRLTLADQQQLETLARALKSAELLSGRFTIAGHTDASGDALVNEKLSCARALSARSHLIERGVGAERLGAYGFGSSRPRNTGADAENRRVEFRRSND